MRSRLKGAISADEFLDSRAKNNPVFLDVDPKDGFSVRNFQIQAAKMAMVSDIVIYRSEDVTNDEFHGLAKSISKAQRVYEERRAVSEEGFGQFHTFVVNSEFYLKHAPHTTLALISIGQFSEFEENHRELVGIDSQGRSTGQVMDFCGLSRSRHFGFPFAS